MEETNRIILNKFKDKVSINEDTLLDIDLTSTEKKFGVDNIDAKLNQYKQYIKENDESKKNRFVFTINPICTNVLFNHVSEIVENDGSDNCVFYGSTGKTISNDYVNYKYGSNTTTVNREKLIRDTSYSHKDCGDLTYHCGIDIFNNHTLRNKEFVIVNKQLSGSPTSKFNEIGDFARDYNGDVMTEVVSSENSETQSHLYFRGTLLSFEKSIKNNLIEKDGWVGFTNKNGFDAKNATVNNEDISLNKTININNASCEFIDLYPDRTLFSFLPKKNGNRNRYERNWDYCLTYPYMNYYDNELVSYKDNLQQNIFNGIPGCFVNSFGEEIDANDFFVTGLTSGDENRDVIIRTNYRNNIYNGDYVRIHLIYTKITSGIAYRYKTVKTKCLVKSTGLNGFNNQYYFSISIKDIIDEIEQSDNNTTIRDLKCYVQKIVKDRECKYYFRLFKRIPNFNNTDVLAINGLSDSDINKYCFNEFNSSLNRLAFSRNVYNDKVAQIVYNDTIDLTGLKDNLGRDLHEVFLTIVKRNAGHELWYNDNPIYSSETIECSHCFGDVTSGIEMPPYVNDYNVHKLHNIDKTVNDATVNLFIDNYKTLESGLTISGLSYNNNDGIFFGDIVELDEFNVEETVLETVCHRFNTAQREALLEEYSKMSYDEITSDDFDGNFNVNSSSYTGNYRANLAPEGYYYKAHYATKIREFSENVNEGQHTLVKFDKIDKIKSGEYSGRTDKNYYFEVGKEILIYYNKVKYGGIITEVSGADFRNIKFKANLMFTIDIKKCVIFKPNELKPITAYDFNDGSGIYRWRNFESCANIKTDDELYDATFTNGCHYFHKNVNFFLRRQDPLCDYGLNYNCISVLPDIEIFGEYKNIEQVDSVIGTETTLC